MLSYGQYIQAFLLGHLKTAGSHGIIEPPSPEPSRLGMRIDMSKILIIDTCDMCPYFSNEYSPDFEKHYEEKCIKLGVKITDNFDCIQRRHPLLELSN